MRISLLVRTLGYVSCVFAQITYNLVGYPDSVAGSFGVLINGTVSRLSTSNVTFPLWSGQIPKTTISTIYKYVKLSDNGTVISEEPFIRTFLGRDWVPDIGNPNNISDHKTALITLNEFFGRQTTWNKLPEIPRVFENVEPIPSEAFDDAQIATIHITLDQVKFSAMVADPWTHHEAISADFRFINSHLIYNAPGANLELFGKSSRNFRKLSFKFTFDTLKNQTFFNRPNIKLRAEGYDPTMIREKLYIDVLNSIGVRTQQGTWVRLYVNNIPYGFYLMLDDMSTSFLRQTMHNGDNQPAVLGSLYQMISPKIDIQADLQYLGPTAEDYPDGVYTNKNLGTNPPNNPLAQLIGFMKDIEEFEPIETNGTLYWNSRMDLEGFLRVMALEFLGGSWDGYWWAGSNYYLYFNPALADSNSTQQGKWQWIPTDFDSTFGDGRPTDIQTAYQEYAPRLLKHDHPLVSKLILENYDTNIRFEELLLEIVRVVFNPTALFPRIDAYEQMIAADVQWDLSIDRSKLSGKDLQYTIQDFHDSIVKEVTGVNIGIKPWIEQRAKDIPNQVRVSNGASSNMDVGVRTLIRRIILMTSWIMQAFKR